MLFSNHRITSSCVAEEIAGAVSLNGSASYAAEKVGEATSMRNKANGESLETNLDAFWRCTERGEQGRIEEAIFNPPLRSGVVIGLCTYKRPQSCERFLESLLGQSRIADQFILVDASSGEETEKVLERALKRGVLARETIYVRVKGGLKGLTRQRNLVLHLAERATTIFFDDDVVLQPGCIAAMQAVLENHPEVIGVGASDERDTTEPAIRWKLLKKVGAVSELVPGKYDRSGLALPLVRVSQSIETDRLAGSAMGWRTEMARHLEFSERFHGYAQSEDVEFSRRAARYGKLLVSSDAKMFHFHDVNGRPDLVELGKMGVLNRFYIHKTTLLNRTWKDTLKFWYGNFFYELLVALGYVKDRHVTGCFKYAWGVALGGWHTLRGRADHPLKRNGTGCK